MVDGKVIALVALWCGYWLLLTPILIYYAIRFYQLRFTQIIRKRFYRLTIFLALASMFTVAIYSPFYLLRVYYVYGQNKTFVAMEIFYVPMYAVCIYSIAAFLTLRFWCLWYYVRWTSLVIMNIKIISFLIITLLLI